MGNQKRILIVDDSAVVTATFKRVIEKTFSYECITAASKQQTQEMLDLHKNNFDVALLDLNLPDASDGEVIDLVSQYKIPIIVLTGSIDSENRLRQKEIVDYVIKDGSNSIYYVLGIIKQLIKNRDIKVLVVDDSKLALKKVSDLLHRYNLNVFTANDGVEALEVFEKNKDIKLIFTDYMMPNMDGLELTKELRKKYRKNQLSIIVTSASLGEGTTSSKFLRYGANDFLHKNFSAEEFYARLNVNLEILGLFEDIELQNKEKAKMDKLIFEQSKKIAMSDLLKNIAHHWRQPLSAISTIGGKLLLNKDIQIFNSEDEEKIALDQLINTTNNLSKTIEEFRTLFNFADTSENFDAIKEISNYIEVIKPNFNDSNIKIIIDNNAKNSIIFGSIRAFRQILINLFVNSQEAIADTKMQNGAIYINTSSKNDYFQLEIFDNGGGVDANILETIFDPYITTRHQYFGKGMGLFITREIIHNGFNATIQTDNHSYTINGNNFTGLRHIVKFKLI